MANTLMQRVARDAMEPAIRDAAANAEAVSGDATIIEVIANSTPTMTFFLGDFYAGLFFGGEVPLKFKELGRLKLSVIHGCQFCNRNNTKGAREAGFSEDQINAVIDDNDTPFDAAEKAVLDLARELALTNPGGHLTPDLYARLKAHFTDAQIVELSTVMAVLGGLNKMAFTLELVEREPSCPFVPAAAAAAE